MDFFLKTIHFIKYFKVHLRIKNRDFYPLDFDTGKKIEEVQILGLQSPPPKNYCAQPDFGFLNLYFLNFFACKLRDIRFTQYYRIITEYFNIKE